MSGAMKTRSNLGDLFFALSVNFLLYCALIIVFYLLVRFYLEEEATHNERGYSKVKTTTEEDDDVDELNVNDEDGLMSDSAATLKESLPPPPPSTPATMNAGFTPRLSELSPNDSENDVIKYNQNVMRQVIFCSLGLIASFSVWGLVQERMLTQPYDDVYFEYSYGLVFLNRLGGLVLSVILMYYFKIRWIEFPLWEYSFPSVANMLSSWCQYEAVKYVSFPTQMLAKAFKIVPVMLMGKFLHDKTYESYEYVAAAMIGFGLYLFINSSESVDLSTTLLVSHSEINGPICGLALLVLYLFFDSFTGQFQTHMFRLNNDMSPVQMMLIMNAFSAVFSFVTLIHQEELYPSLEFVMNHTTIISHLLIFCVCSTVGQLFIFHTVKRFGPVVFSIIMAGRILVSTLLSCFVYSHPVTEMGVIGILIVFGSIGYRTQRQIEKKPLFLWKEKIETKFDIVHEWHEHLDI